MAEDGPLFQKTWIPVRTYPSFYSLVNLMTASFDLIKLQEEFQCKNVA